MRIFAICLLISAFTVAGCDLLALLHPPRDGGGEVPQPVIVVRADAFPDAGWPRAPMVIQHGHIRGDVLYLDVAYSGGCAAHAFPLYAADVFAESWPVQAQLALAHDDNDDACDGWVEREVRHSLVPLKQTYWRQYGRTDAGGTIVLNIQNLNRPDSVLTLRYSF